MNHKLEYLFKLSTFSVALLMSALTGFAQISPGEITDPQLRVVEQSYLPKLIEINHAVGETKFPFLFSLSRYVGLDPKEQASADKRALEFVNFHGRVVLKTTGNYNAAYNASLLTPNQRADKTLDDVIQPILLLMANRFTADDRFDAFGFEIGYHVRTKTSGIDYEGKENLVVVMDKADAFNYAAAKDDSARQQILSRAEVFVNGKQLNVQRGGREPFSLEAVNAIVSDQQRTPAEIAATEDVNALLHGFESAPLRSVCSLAQILRRPEISMEQLRAFSAEIPSYGPNVDAQVEIQLKYQGYVDRQSAIVERFRRMEQAILPANLDYTKISGLSREVCEKLIQIKPQSLGQAARIPGITPAAISLLSFYIKKKSA